MNGELLLYIDQYGAPIWARTIAELQEKAGGGKLFKIYVDKIAGEHAGKSVHCGYGVGCRWFNAYRPVERVAS